MKFVFCALALALAAPALAQTPAADARFAATTLDLTGHGEARVPPDMARVTLGVSNVAPTAEAAMAGDSAAMTRVVGALRAGGVDPRDIRTMVVALSPQYAPSDKPPPKITGYQATNTAVVTVNDLAKLGAVVQAAVEAGATNVEQISLDVKNRGSAENFARLAAVKDLDDKAATFADAAGYHVRRLVNLSEGAAARGIQYSLQRLPVATSGAYTVPVEAGDIVVSVDVTGEFELTH